MSKPSSRVPAALSMPALPSASPSTSRQQPQLDASPSSRLEFNAASKKRPPDLEWHLSAQIKVRPERGAALHVPLLHFHCLSASARLSPRTRAFFSTAWDTVTLTVYRIDLLREAKPGKNDGRLC